MKKEREDETVLSVLLPSPVTHHGEIILLIAFRARLPRFLARTGYVRDFHLAGLFFFSSRRRHTSFSRDWSSDVCSSDLHRQLQHQGVPGWAGTGRAGA